MKRLIAPALIAFALAGSATAETRAVSGFRGVEAEDKVDVAVSIGSAYAVEVTGRDAARIRTHVGTDGTLHIQDDRRPWFGRSPELDANVRVTGPAFRSISSSRGAELTANLSGGACNTLSAAASMGGTASITGAQCGDVSSAASMGGELQIAGACRNHNVSASMGGYVRAEGLACETVDASASMGGDVRAHASRTYDASASMGGAINVSGGANARDTAAVMGGAISRR
jgi:hypothetical protein